MAVATRSWIGPRFIGPDGRHHTCLVASLARGAWRVRGFAEQPMGEVVRLPGGYAFAGFIDAHAHLGRLGEHPDAITITGSADDLLAQVRRRASTQPAGSWITGFGWRALERELMGGLDRLSSAHPICLLRHDAHAVWANSAALRSAGLDRRTTDPAGGRIERDVHGIPTGVLIESAAELVRSLVPPVDADILRTIVLEECQAFLATGVTCVHEMVVGAEMASALDHLASAERLPLRVRGYLWAADPGLRERWSRGPDSPAGRAWELRGLKLFADGALGSRGARMLRPYPDGTYGVKGDPERLFTETIDAARRHGWQVAVHAIGDRGVREALDRMLPHVGRRWRIEHAQVVSGVDLARWAPSGVLASLQPLHAVHDLPWAASLLGEAQVEAYRWASFSQAGVGVALGTDHPIERAGVVRTLYAATTRRDPDVEGNEELPGISEVWSRAEAVHAHGPGAAALAFDEDHLGSLVPGRLADFAVWSHDLLRCSPESLRRASCKVTVVGGQISWSR